MIKIRKKNKEQTYSCFLNEIEYKHSIQEMKIALKALKYIVMGVIGVFCFWTIIIPMIIIIYFLFEEY